MNLLYINIKKRREELGLSQDELARRVGYKTRSSINKIEAGKADIPQSKIEAFAKALDTTPAYLMGWEESENFGLPFEPELIKKATFGVRLVDDNDATKLLEYYYQLNSTNRKMLLGAAEALAKAEEKEHSLQ